MATGTLLLLLISSLAWSGLDLARKLLADRIDALALVIWLGLGQGLLLGGYALWEGLPVVSPAYWLPGLASIGLNIAGNVLFVLTLLKSPYSLCVPMLALTPVFTTLLAMPLLGEYPSLRQVAGIGLIVAGAFWLNWPQGDGGWRQFLKARGAIMMVVVAAIWAMTSPADKLATHASGPAFHGAVVNLGMALGTLIGLAGMGKLSRLGSARAHWPALLGASLIGAVAIQTQFLVMNRMLVSLIEAVKRMVGLAMAVVAGRLLFQEPVTPTKMGAIALMSAGLWLVLA